MTDNWWQDAPVFKSEAPAGGGNWWDAASVVVPPEPTRFNFDRPPAEIRAEIATLPPKQRDEIVKQWGEARDLQEKKQGLGPGALNTNLLRGTPIGSFLDEGEAGANALLNLVSGGRTGLPYDEGLALARARNRRIDAESTKIGTLPVIGDVTVGGVQKVAGGIASAAAAPIANVFQGATLAPRAANAAISGAGYGGLYGFGEGEGATTQDGFANRMWDAAGGAAIGAGIGAVAPAIGEGVANAVSYARRPPAPQALQGYAPGAVQRVARAVEADGLDVAGPSERIRQANVIQRAQWQNPGDYELSRARLNQNNPALGDEGMMVDMGTNLFRQGETLVNRPGEQATQARQALSDRSLLRPSRIANEVDNTLGPARADDITARDLERQANEAARPFYDQFRQERIVPTNQLVDILQRVPQNVYQAAVDMARTDGINIRTHLTRGLDGTVIDYIKRGLDDAARSVRLTHPNAHRQMSGLAADLRGEVDNILVGQGAVARDAAGAPIMNAQGEPVSVYAHARALSGDGKDLRDAIQLGNSTFQRGVSSRELGAEMQGMTQPERDALAAGARNEIRRMQVTNTTDGRVLNPLANPDARTKLRMVMPDYERDPNAAYQAAGRLGNRFDAESKMLKTEQAMLGNSQTQPRQMAAREFPMPIEPGDPAVTGLRQSSITGLMAEGAYRIANALTGGVLNERRLAVANDAARMLFAQRATREEILRGLRQYIAAQNINRQAGAQLMQNAQRVIEGARSEAVAETNRPRGERRPESLPGPRRSQ